METKNLQTENSELTEALDLFEISLETLAEQLEVIDTDTLKGYLKILKDQHKEINTSSSNIFDAWSKAGKEYILRKNIGVFNEILSQRIYGLSRDALISMQLMRRWIKNGSTNYQSKKIRKTKLTHTCRITGEILSPGELIMYDSKMKSYKYISMKAWKIVQSEDTLEF